MNLEYIKDWIEMMPMAEVANFFPFNPGTLTYSEENIFGFLIDKADADALDVASRKEAIYMQGGPALHVVFEIPSVQQEIQFYGERIMLEALRRQLKPTGMPHTRLITSLYHGAEHPYYVHHWLPVENTVFIC